MAANPKLRAYQRTAIESARRALTKSGSCILQMPTGAGKTRAATEIVATSRGVIWFVCHRQEIERQVAKAFTAAGIEFGVVSPRGEFEPKKRVQIVSVHTLRKSIKKLPAPKLVIWDECHHVAAKSWASIRAKLKDARHLGLTATPERLDGKGLGEWFAELVTGPGIAELIKKGFLSEFRYFAPSDPDLTNAKLQAGDYKKSDLGSIMNTPVLIGDAVREYKKNAKGKRALAFCASVEASQALAARFNKEGISAGHVDGTTPTAERDAAIADLAAGRIKVLCNVEVFTEGFDLPAIDAVILMRPTKSLALFLQMIGRGLRKAVGKDGSIIFDHAGLWLDHGKPDQDMRWSLDGGARELRLSAAKADGGRLRRCPECKEVRFERVEVCDCGYEFPTGREIGEFDGQLYELRSAVPDGCCTKTEFSRIVGSNRTAVDGWLERGLPNENGYPKLVEGRDWVSENVRVIMEGCESQNKFSKRMSVASATITDWIKRGLPIDRNKSVLINEGIEWVRENIKVIPIGHETMSSFARRHGMKCDDVRPLIRRGMPYSKNTGVPIQEADSWMASQATETNPIPDGCLSKAEFAKINRKNLATVYHWINSGLPNISGYPLAIEGAKWVSSRITPHPNSGYERKSAFARRVGVSCQKTVSGWINRGLPCSADGHPHIQRGLEWVRDNTNIKIPASAWPNKAARVKHDRPQEEQRASA